MTIGDRLREERKRLDYNQPNLAALGGVHKNTLIDYEKNRTPPAADFLSAIAAVGADVQYIVIGKRSININEESALYSIRPDQKALLDNYEHCSKEDKDAIKRMAFLRLHECFGVSVDWLLSGSGEMFSDGPLVDKPRALIPDFQHTDTGTVKDCLWLSARAIEQSMIECGAVPGEDYSMLDLYKMAVYFAAIRFEKSGAELSASTEF